ncbi:nucleotidyltransferase family protein [Sphingopyxis sp. DHUNG17]|uniref:nucleotidyltransferase domain-containing protein n=1 Tax=Sphingopyxis jiangsuensis TaxID=2871171 RepID=UPI00191D53A2|nr:nucleotidyltransferase family protein [Sphingopyxis lutea]MBL0767402.1 nucleotidyltransferase family protein [Sphingopyxis lutea]
MSAAHTLVDLLAGRRDAATLGRGEWDGVISAARAEAMLATLAHRLADATVPPAVAALFADQRAAAATAQQQALWEAEMARRALAPRGIEFVLLKGTAYAAAGLSCSEGRQIGDLDILVIAPDVRRAENALLNAGWEWVKSDPYDDHYYREYMHELPPLIHKTRDRMIDVHHTILPRTHRTTPDALAMVSDAVRSHDGFAVLSPADMACHCAAHLIADGDLQGGLRNLWDFHCLTRDFAAADAHFWGKLDGRAELHGLRATVDRAARLARDIYGAELPPGWDRHVTGDGWFRRRLLARDDWGRSRNWLLQQAFYLRSHWLRMPPAMLARHLWTKWRKR